MDEDEDGGLRAFAQVLLGYGERHFDSTPNQQGSRRGVWAGVLLMCGQFERVGGSIYSSLLQFNRVNRRSQRYGSIKIQRLRPYTLQLHWPTMGCFACLHEQRPLI